MKLAAPRLPETPPPVAWWEWAALAVATIAGAVLRFAGLENLPPGLWYDEAINGLDALSILNEPGLAMFFTTEGHPREPLYIYLELLGIWSGGTTPWALRAVSAAIGTLTIPAVWWMARLLGGRRMGMLVLLFFVPMRWHVHFSRLAFRTILSPLFGALVAVFLFRALRGRRPRDATACGVLLGASMYTYLSMRLFAGAVVFLAGWWLLVSWRNDGARPALRLALAGVVAALLVFAPLGINYALNPDHMTGRQSEISLLRGGTEGWSRIARQARDVALMPVIRGDHVPKHNIPGPPRFAQTYLWAPSPEEAAMSWSEARADGRSLPDVHGTGAPLFDLLTGLVFFAGLVLAVWRLAKERDAADGFMLAWIGFGSLASILSFGAPNMLRLLLLTPPAAWCLARAGDFAIEKLSRPRPSALAWAPVVALAAWFAAGETWRYYSVWPRHPAVWTDFNSNFVDLARVIRDSPTRPETVVVPEYILNGTPTFAFMARDIPGLVSDTEAKHQIEPPYWVVSPMPPFPPVAFEPPADRTVSGYTRLSFPNGMPWVRILEVR